MRTAIACGLLLMPALTPAADPPKPRYEVRRNHDRDGTGKFYLGREIAPVMGFQGAGWLERPERVKEEEPAKLIAALELKPGMVVADVGAGSGYHAFLMSPLVGDTGKVLAVDIQPEMLALVKANAKKRGITNVGPVEGTETDPKLPAAGVDLILMVDVYHELSHPYEMTENLVAALKPGGRLVFVEFRLEDPKVPIKLVHKMTERQIIKEMAEFPELEHTKTVNTLPWQHVAIFTKAGKKPK
ncbi:MAG: class I SAM-dependent methyltransferase [Fimbriiglobus sp.]